MVPRFAVLSAAGDHVINQQLVYGDTPRTRLLDALAATGAAVDELRVEADGCGHDDYLLPGRPECGYAVLRDTLRAALEP